MANKVGLVVSAMSALAILYFLLRPFTPHPLRYWLRRRVALRKLRRVGDVWPIRAGTEHPPAPWPGWPDGKDFAVVLTHDVEGRRGLSRCSRLLDLEEAAGFRSAFFLVPEGEYRVSRELRQQIEGRGFEVAIHDLYHDGSLFRSRESFDDQAARINRYVLEWNASGFRAGFMFHNLAWQHALQVRYDASTFDTDPFEPQPDGAHTIFPFWVPGSGGQANGFVELPYTLVQDSTLFLSLGASSIDFWKRKVDWIAKHGGMVLALTHPDYMSFEHTGEQWREYPAERYRELLDYLRTRYAGRYWHALPREVAEYCATVKPTRSARAPKRVCMVTHSYYESDGRVRRYAESLAERGDVVEVLALRRAASTPREEDLKGVRVVRIQDRFEKSETSAAAHLRPLLRFVLAASRWLSRSHRERRFDLVHVHNIPDFVVFAAWYPKFTGVPIILDIHDIVPELFASKFGARARRPVVALLRLVERASAAFADRIIIANDLWLDTYTSRSASHEKCSVFVNNVDARVYRPSLVPRLRDPLRPIVMFPGGLQWHQGVDIAIRAFAKLQRQLPGAVFLVYGDGSMKAQLVALVRELGLERSVHFFDPVSTEEIAAIMAQADLGVVPKRADSFGNEAYSTKIMEFMAVGVPVVVSSTRVDRFYFDETVVRFFASGDDDALAEAMYELLSDDERRQSQIAAANEFVARNHWGTRKGEYLELVDALCARV